MGKLVLVVVLASCSAFLFYLTYKLMKWCINENVDDRDGVQVSVLCTLTSCIGLLFFGLLICLLTGGATLN
jgi:hypothetical protein